MLPVLVTMRTCVMPLDELSIAPQGEDTFVGELEVDSAQSLHKLQKIVNTKKIQKRKWKK